MKFAPEGDVGRWQADAKPSVRDLFYHGLRRGDGRALRAWQSDGGKLQGIGDANRAGETMDAIESAFAVVYGAATARPLQVSAQGKTY